MFGLKYSLTYEDDAYRCLSRTSVSGASDVDGVYDDRGRIDVLSNEEFRWLLRLETVAASDNSVTTIEYVWGKDISGSLGGTAGIGGLLYTKINGVIYVPQYDAYGNIIGYCDATGSVVATYTYDAFGRTIAQSGSLADVFAFRYSTKYFDRETGFYYYGKRYYSPALRRWLTRDPIEEEGGLNLYAMCENDMLSRFDSIGQVEYSELAANYPKPSDYPTDITMTNNIWQLIGGMVLYNAQIGQFKNSCAVRLSHSLNKSGEVIPFIKGKTSSGKKTTKGKVTTNWWYIYRVSQMKIYLSQKFGKPATYRKREKFENVLQKEYWCLI